MSLINNKTTLKSIILLGFLSSTFVSSVMANQHEADCAKYIQNTIAWDDNGHTKWEQANIDKLCQGTTKPAEPGECFNKVMNGHVKWGNGDKWKWENAIRLCSGTDDSDNTINCFQSRIKANTAWEEAILQCQLKTPSHKSMNPVNMN